MLKKIFVPLMLSLACALMLAACGSSDNSGNASNAGSTNKSTTTTTTTTNGPSTTTTTQTTNTSTTTASTGDTVGVPECDEYLTKLQACLAKLPAAAKPTWDSAYEQTKKAWRDAAATPQGKASLAQACKAATDTARQSLKSFGCEF
jgi:ABC-type oligopeptide transport system substrate-binding subunit